MMYNISREVIETDMIGMIKCVVCKTTIDMGGMDGFH